MASKPGHDTLLVASSHGRTSVPPFCKSKDRAALPPELVDIMHIDFRGRRTAVEAEVEYRSKLVPHYKGVIILVGGNNVANLSCCADGNIANHVPNPVKKELAKIAQSLLSLRQTLRNSCDRVYICMLFVRLSVPPVITSVVTPGKQHTLQWSAWGPYKIGESYWALAYMQWRHTP